MTCNLSTAVQGGDSQQNQPLLNEGHSPEVGDQTPLDLEIQKKFKEVFHLRNELNYLTNLSPMPPVITSFNSTYMSSGRIIDKKSEGTALSEPVKLIVDDFKPTGRKLKEADVGKLILRTKSEPEITLCVLKKIENEELFVSFLDNPEIEILNPKFNDNNWITFDEYTNSMKIKNYVSLKEESYFSLKNLSRNLTSRMFAANLTRCQNDLFLLSQIFGDKKFHNL